MFHEALPFKNGQLLIPSLSQLQSKTIVALCMRLSVCKYGTERQACAYQIVLVTLQSLVPAPMSLPVTWPDGDSIFVSVFVDVGLFVRCLHLFSNCGSLHAVSQGEGHC